MEKIKHCGRALKKELISLKTGLSLFYAGVAGDALTTDFALTHGYSEGDYVTALAIKSYGIIPDIAAIAIGVPLLYYGLGSALNKISSGKKKTNYTNALLGGFGGTKLLITLFNYGELTGNKLIEFSSLIGDKIGYASVGLLFGAASVLPAVGMLVHGLLKKDSE